MKKVLFLSVLALTVMIGIGVAESRTASAGEYSRGNGGTAAKDQAYAGTASICSFNGADESDETEVHGEEGGDDEQWGATPSGGHAQSGGQMVAAFGPDAVKGAGFSWACNPNSGFEE